MCSQYIEIVKYFSFGEKDPEHNEFTFGKCITFTLGTLTTRGWSATPSTNTARIVFAM